MCVYNALDRAQLSDRRQQYKTDSEIELSVLTKILSSSRPTLSTGNVTTSVAATDTNATPGRAFQRDNNCPIFGVDAAMINKQHSI